MLVDTRGDERVRDLHEQGGGPAEEKEALAVYLPGDAVDRQDAGVAHPRSVRPSGLEAGRQTLASSRRNGSSTNHVTSADRIGMRPATIGDHRLCGVTVNGCGLQS